VVVFGLVGHRNDLAIRKDCGGGRPGLIEGDDDISLRRQFLDPEQADSSESQKTGRVDEDREAPVFGRCIQDGMGRRVLETVQQERWEVEVLGQCRSHFAMVDIDLSG
jgi:hypothetical protein